MKVFLLLSIIALAAACARDGSPEASAPKALSCAAAPDGALSVSNAWIREQSDPGAMTAAYFTVCNGTMEPATLTGVASAVAGLVELHETSRDSAGIVSMAPTGDIILAPGELVVFEPGGKHAMLMSLASAVRVGETSALTLEFADSGAVVVDAIVRSAIEAATVHEEGGH